MAQIGDSMDTFTIRDLRERTGELVRDAEAGRLSLVTKHGRPVFVAVPFDDLLLREGVPVALAVRLFQQGDVSIGKAARLAGRPLQQFMGILAARNIPFFDQDAEELAGEVGAFAP